MPSSQSIGLPPSVHPGTANAPLRTPFAMKQTKPTEPVGVLSSQLIDNKVGSIDIREESLKHYTMSALADGLLITLTATVKPNFVFNSELAKERFLKLLQRINFK